MSVAFCLISRILRLFRFGVLCCFFPTIAGSDAIFYLITAQWSEAKHTLREIGEQILSTKPKSIFSDCAEGIFAKCVCARLCFSYSCCVHLSIWDYCKCWLRCQLEEYYFSKTEMQNGCNRPISDETGKQLPVDFWAKLCHFCLTKWHSDQFRWSPKFLPRKANFSI